MTSGGCSDVEFRPTLPLVHVLEQYAVWPFFYLLDTGNEAR